MSKNSPTAERMTESVSLVDDAVAVGEDLNFQRRWWRFERFAWIVLAIVLVSDALGLFGRGWLARTERVTPDGTLKLNYERIERAGTPSEMTLLLGPSAIQHGQAHLFVSEAIVRQLGAQRVIPQPLTSEIGPDGILYTFPASGPTATLTIALEPSFPGVHEFRIAVPGSQPINARIAVLP